MSRRIMWTVEVPEHLDRQLEEYIRKGGYKTKSEFIRTAVRDRLKEEMEKLEKEGLIR